MKFDNNGNHIRSICKTSQIHDNVVIELDSRFTGLSDKSVRIVQDMVQEENFEKLQKLLNALNRALS